MQVFVKIHDKTNIININDDEPKKLIKLLSELEIKTGFNRNFFKLRTASKLFLKEEDLYNEITIQLVWNSLLCKKLYIDSFNSFNVPLIVLKESNVILNILDTIVEDNNESNKIIFDSNTLISGDLVNDWINMSFLIKNYLGIIGSSLPNLEIPKPLKSKSLKVYIGDEAYEYLDNKDIEELKKLATFTDYLDIPYLLETVCAFIAEKYLKNKNLEDISKLNII